MIQSTDDSIICSSCHTPRTLSEFDGDTTQCVFCVIKNHENVVAIPSREEEASYTARIRAIQQTGSPQTVDIAEAFMASVGGADSYGRELATMYRRISGEGLTDEAKRLFVDEDRLLQFHRLVATLAKSHDATVSSGDPLEDVPEEDLRAMAGAVALDLIRESPEFRQRMITELVAIAPTEIINAQEAATSQVLYGPAVEVVP